MSDEEILSVLTGTRNLALFCMALCVVVAFVEPILVHYAWKLGQRVGKGREDLP